MKKNYLLLLSVWGRGSAERVKAVRIFFLVLILSSISFSGYSQVIVTPANNTTICAQTAVGGGAPACTTLGVIALTETATTDFVIGNDQLTLVPPPGWVFCTAPLPTLAKTGGDITVPIIPPGGLTATSLLITFTATAQISLDQITITGLQVQPASTSAPAGSIRASLPGTVGITGVTGATDFGDLAIIPAPITSITMVHSICKGDTITLTDATPGGVWTSSNTSVAIVANGNVDVVGKGVGSANITYTVAGCYQLYKITVLAAPSPIAGVPSTVCAWFDRFYVHATNAADSPGVYSTGSMGITVTPVPSIYVPTFYTGTGYVRVNQPGQDTIKFTLVSTGCTVYDIFTVNPLPTPILGNDTVCEGSTTLLSDAFGGGAWTSSNTNISINSGSGLVTGIKAGTSTVFYTLPSGCKLDTVVYVNPIPAAIAGSPFACFGSTTVLSDATPGGTWSSSNTNVVTVTPSGGYGIVKGILSGGVATISYTLSTGCYVTLDVTVNPVPLPITASSTEECQGDSSIVLTDPSGGGNWVSVNPAIGTVDNFTGSVYGVSGGVDTVEYAFATGCNAMITVTIDPLPSPITGPDSLCQGQVIKLTDATPSSRMPTAWTSSNTTIATVDPTGDVYGVPTGGGGPVTITYTLPTGCFVTYSITVNPLPGPIMGPNVLCVGSSITLSDATPGGLWYSSNTSSAIIDSVSGVVNGIAFGSSAITYRLITGGCFNVPFFTVTVTPKPSIITGPTTVCVGQFIILSDSVGGGTWTSSNTLVSTVVPYTFTTGKVTGISTTPGYDTIFYSVGGTAGCTVYQLDTVLNLGPITGGLLCVGDSTLFTDPVGPGVWSSSNTAIAFADSTTGNIYGVAAGTATISYSLASGCVAQIPVTVNPKAAITASDTVMCVGQSVVLCNTVPGGTWSDDNTAIAIPGVPFGASCDTFYGIANGTTIVAYTLPSGCKSLLPITVNPNPPPFGPDSVCQGSLVTIIETSVDTGTWSNKFPSLDTFTATTGFTVTIRGVAPGLDTITFTLATGCYAKDTLRIFPASPIVGDSFICVGDTSHLTNATTGGTWSSSNTAVGSIDPTSGLFTGITAGTTTIVYTTTHGCPAMVTMTVNPLPGAITGTDSVCVGAMVTFSDTPPGGTWGSSLPGIGSIGSSSGIVTGIAAGTTTITYTITATGCKATTVVTVNPIPSPIAPSPADVCLNFTILMTDPSIGGVWSNANTIISHIGTSGLDTGIAPGVDTIFYTFPITGCYVYQPLTVHAPPVDTVTQSPGGTICVGGSDTLMATGAGTGPGSGYTWIPAYGLSATTGSPVIASPTITTTYTVFGKTTFGCLDTDKITVVVDTLLNHLKITGWDSICAGDSTVLIATGNDGTRFAWNPITGLHETVADTVTASPAVTTTYEATAIDRIGCKDSVAITITVLPPPILSVIGEPNTFPIVLCRGTPLQLIARGAWSYVWTPNLFLSCDSCANPVATDTFNMVYELTGYSQFGCVDSIPVRVSVLDTNYNIVGNDTAICFRTKGRLFAFSHSVTGNLDQPTYLWSPPDGLSDPTSPDPFVSPGSTTTYTLVITENACFKDTDYVKVSVEPYPVINLTPHSETINAGTSVQLIAEVLNTPVKSYIWSPTTGISCDTCFNPIAVPPGGSITYTITVTSIYGCTTYDTVTFISGCNSGQVFIPNTFTPNGDGVNDRFFVSAIGLKTIVFLRVYNRWGQLVFEGDNMTPNNSAQGWDGTFKGQVLEPDVFIYEVSAICELGAPFTYKGDISIVR
jgi:gliding motility-associated-like protein